jgi:hypothetical protein
MAYKGVTALLRFKYTTTLVLFGICGLLFTLAWFRYPHPIKIQLATPGYVYMDLTTKVRNREIYYRVDQQGLTTSIMLTAAATRRVDNKRLTLYLHLPHGTHFATCDPSNCDNKSFYANSTRTVTYNNGYAHISFRVHTAHLSWNANEQEAIVVTPFFYYTGKGQPFLSINMAMADANTYVWSSLPPSYTNRTEGGWLERVTHGQVEAIAASGTNRAALQEADKRTFETGLAIGIASGALIGAIQEALRAAGERRT